MPEERWQGDDSDGDDDADDEEPTTTCRAADDSPVSAWSPLTLKTHAIVETCPPGVRFWHDDPRRSYLAPQMGA